MKLTKRRIFIGILIGCVLTVIFACSFAYLNPSIVWDIVDRLCKNDTILAQFDAGNDRQVIISTESCPEIGRSIRYEVIEKGFVVLQKSTIDIDDLQREDYTLVFADNKSLVGVVDLTASVLNTPPLVVAIYDFNSHDRWSRFGRIGKGNTLDLFARLKAENPDLNFPD